MRTAFDGENAGCHVIAAREIAATLNGNRLACALISAALGWFPASAPAETSDQSADDGASTWTCSGSNEGSSARCSVPDIATGSAGTKLGINLGWVNDWADRGMMFVDVMKNARGFAQPAHFWDPADYPVPLDAEGWPTTDFGVTFLSTPGDPLNRPLTTTFPSMFGTYSLSFTGRATVAGGACCTIKNVVYDVQTNTTTGKVVVGPNDNGVSLVFTGTNGGVQNLKLLRPGYAPGTTQVFTTQFLNAIAPFSTLRFMDTLQTNGSPVTSWEQRTRWYAPTQNAVSGLAWGYVIELANRSGKDIWVNIPEGVDLTDPTPNNYAARLANLMKDHLKPGIHVYLEYSNEVWNGSFPQSGANLNSAISEVASGADPTLNYDNANNQWTWASRRVMHQVLRISQLFENVYGAAAINTTIRPLYLAQYVQPYMAEDALAYMTANFGAPNRFIYGIGGAPYFGDGNAYTTVPAVIAGLQSDLAATDTGFAREPYHGGIVYSPLSYKGLADYYGIKSVSYEGGPALSPFTSAAIDEEAESDAAMGTLVENYFADWFGCGNDLFMYFDLAEPEGNVFGAYEDLSIPMPKSKALSAVSAQPLSSYRSCSKP